MRWLESQIETRAKLDAQITERAYAELATSVTDQRTSPVMRLSELEQTDGAVRTCLRYCGATPGAIPEGATDPSQRIEYLCRPSGTMYRTITLSGTWYKKSFGAILAYLKTGEALALLPQGIGGYVYYEAGTGRKVRVNAQVAQNIKPEATMFYKSLPARALTVRDLLQFLFSAFDRADYALVIVAALAVTLIGLVPAQVNQIAFSTVVPSGQIDLVLPLGALLLGVAISTALITATRNLVMARLSTKLHVITEAATFSRLLTLPPSFFKTYAAGDLGERVNGVTMMAEEIVTVLLGGGLSAFLSLIYVVQIGMYAPGLVVPVIVVMVVQAALTLGTTLANVRYDHTMLESSLKLSGTVTALLNGIQKIKLAGAENRAFAKWASGYSDYAKNAYNRPVVLRLLPAFAAFVGLAGGVAFYFFAATSNVSVADYMAFSVAYGQVNAAILAFVGMAGQIAHMQSLLETVSPILQTAPEVSENKPTVGELVGNIEVSNVSFRYSPTSPYVLKDLSFKVRPGEYVALVGKSGCGKSTIMRLMLGFEKPEHGNIFFGPYDVQKVDARSLRQHIGVVMQDSRLFMGNIFSNITISTPAATLDDAWEAAELAAIADDIRKMPMNMQTFVTEGSGSVSGGQRQRLMIARAVCGKRKILMFDEATSALDNLTQRHVSESLESLNCTRIVIAHRLSTVRHCDRILVVDGGTIAEEGTYEELMERGGLFAELVARQQVEL